MCASKYNGELLGLPFYAYASSSALSGQSVLRRWVLETGRLVASSPPAF